MVYTYLKKKFSDLACMFRKMGQGLMKAMAADLDVSSDSGLCNADESTKLRPTLSAIRKKVTYYTCISRVLRMTINHVTYMPSS